MDTKEKGNLIGLIMSELKLAAFQERKQHDEGDVFFSLCFKNDEELLHIAKLCGVKK